MSKDRTSGRPGPGTSPRRGDTPSRQSNARVATLARTTAILAIVVGAAGIITYIPGISFPPGVHPAVRLSNLVAALVEVGLGLGMLRKRRGAWSFLVAAETTLLIINLLGSAALVRSGDVGSLVLAGARVVLFGLLWQVGRAFPQAGDLDSEN